VALVTGLVFISAAFIVLTTLTVSVAQRTRELAVLRCVGASRTQVAGAQLVSGLITCLAGAALGTPLGLLAAWRLHEHYRDALGVPFTPDPSGVLLAASAAALSGLLGSAYPAWRAASVGPLEAMSGQAKAPSRSGPYLCAAVGLVLAVTPFLWLEWAPSLESALLGHLAMGVPLLLVGCFLLCIPIARVIASTASGVIARLFVLPTPLLRQSLASTPYRHGMTGGALMVGVALLVTIWTDGRSIHTGWFTRIQMPDAFLHSFFSLQPAQIERVRGAPAVASLCPTKTFAVKVVDSALGLAGMTDGHTQFVSSDIESFMGMTQLEWVQGDAATALARMRQGRALLVSREYLISRGVGAGSRLTLETLQGPVEFEVVGVVYSPGLDVAVHWFDLQPYYSERSISSVFGTREDAKQHFGVDTANLLLLNLRDDAKDDEALKQLRERAPGTVVGSNRAIRAEVASVVNDSMRVASSIALVSLVIGCLGVGNLVIAHVSARRFELGVLRASGATGALLGRLLAAEALAAALTGSLAGTALGYLLSVAAAVLRNRLFGLGYTANLALDVAALGAVAVTLAALLAAMPPAIRVARSPVTALLAAGRHG
jgi:putative ABC transport system permease protein